MDACPKCTHPHVVNAGMARGNQRWLCRGCGYQFMRATPRRRPLWQKALAVFLYCRGVSMNALGKMFGVCASSVRQWIRRFAMEHSAKPEAVRNAIILEVDEMWHFLKKRHKLWIWKALDRDTGHLLDWECGRRDATPLKQLVDRLARWTAVLYCTDHGQVDAAVIPAERLGMSKDHTDAIARSHGRQRHGFGRFRRRSMIVSKSEELVGLTMALFAQFRVNGDVAEMFALQMIP
jgi:insertion element IS1 protein InsB